MSKDGQPNFFLWGAWKSRIIKEPFLTKKVAAPLKKVVLGETFILGLTEKGKVFSWGKDPKNGCLGLGSDKSDQKIVSRDSPEEVILDEAVALDGDKEVNVKDIQMGKEHVVALTSIGEVYCWGNGGRGQLGIGTKETEWSPKKVESLASEQIVQIAVVASSTFALSASGVVWAWGDNKDNVLGLEDPSLDMVRQPKRLTLLSQMHVRKLEIFENRTIIAHVRATAEEEDEEQEDVDDDKQEEMSVFNGIDAMRKTMQKTQEWWNHMLNIKHGQPYDTPADTALNIQHRPPTADDPETGTIKHDQSIDPRDLHRAEAHLERLVNIAVEELRQNTKPGTKNVRFILCMFIDECRLRREKVQRTLGARELTDAKKRAQEISAYSVTDFGSNANEEIRKIIAVTRELQKILNDIKLVNPVDVLSQELKVTLMECLECKLQLHDTRVELLKAAGGLQSDVVLPALRIIRDRWNSLKSMSLYKLYNSQQTKKLEFSTDDEHLAYLVNTSNRQIEQILQIDKDRIISHDTIVPALCYDLLRENAELRKMSNMYQLHVLMLYSGKRTSGSNIGITAPTEEEMEGEEPIISPRVAMAAQGGAPPGMPPAVSPR